MNYSIIKESTKWSTNSLKKKVENILNEKTKEGYEVVTVAFGLNMWWMPTAFITLRK
jgi:translation elongation factor EF-1beta